MEVAAAAAVVLGVGVGGGGVGVVVVVDAEAEAEAAAVVIESDFHIGICCGVTGFGYGSGMDRVWNGYGSGYGSGMDRGIDRDTLSGPAFPLWLWRKRAGYF